MCPAKSESGAAVYSEAELVRERRCRWHAQCTCDHKACYDGWLDPVPGDPADDGMAHRCPRCVEARDMAEELAEQRAGEKRRKRRGW